MNVSKNSSEIVGVSKNIDSIRAAIEKAAGDDRSVLIQGPSGSGKELIAKNIQQKSKRKDKPFIIINCGAIPENLLESELFGHEKGAFTGAIKKKLGKFELANGGTLFLDEIGDLHTDHQVKILRFLQDGNIEPIGGQTKQVDVRIIAATNKDLLKEINGISNG